MSAPQDSSGKDMWGLAFSKLEEREHQLVADYKKHIHDQLDDGQPNELVLSSPQSMSTTRISHLFSIPSAHSTTLTKYYDVRKVEQAKLFPFLTLRNGRTIY
jgi:hypothetical protein